MTDRTSYIWLNLIPNIIPRNHHRLIKVFGTAMRVLGASVHDLVEQAGFEMKQAQGFVRHRDEVQHMVGRELEQASKQSISILTIEDDHYPALLKKIFDPPIVLYAKGNPQSWQTGGVGMVGSRRPTAYGRMMADKLAGELARRGVTVASGMARGIDTEAHRAALAAKGPTVAVLGCGLAVCYPSENASLMDHLGRADGPGAVVSEFPMATQPFPAFFPRRNRIISGVSWATVVIEAAADSGALITADFAAEQGREVMAVPGPATSPTSQGANRLIQQGAKLVMTVDDLLEDVPALAGFAWTASTAGAGPVKASVRLSHTARKVLSALSEEPLHIDLLVRRSSLPVAQLSAALCELELEGLAKQFPGKLFVRTGA